MLKISAEFDKWFHRYGELNDRKTSDFHDSSVTFTFWTNLM